MVPISDGSLLPEIAQVAEGLDCWISSTGTQSSWKPKKGACGPSYLLLLLPPPGTVDVAQPSRPGLPAQRRRRKAWAPRVFLRHSNGRSAPRAACGRWRSSAPKQNHRRGQLAVHVALDITAWGGLMGGRGHRKGQLRMLGMHSPSALHTKKPRTGGHRGAGSPRTRFSFAKAPC
jgi:hypothetical protein